MHVCSTESVQNMHFFPSSGNQLGCQTSLEFLDKQNQSGFS